MIYLITHNPSMDWWDNHATLHEMLDYFGMHLTVGVDTETSGWSFKTDILRTIQIGDSKNQYIIDMPSLEVNDIKVLVKFLESKELIFQNAAFDLPFLYNIGCRKITVYDTYLAEYVLTMGKITAKRSLDAIIHKYLGIDISKEQRLHIKDYGLQSPEDIQYCATDVAHLIAIKDAQYEYIQELKLDRAVRLENRFVPVLAYIEFCGMYINYDTWYKVTRKNEYYEYGALLELEAQAKELGIENIAWNSPKQVVDAFKSIGIDTFDKKEGKDTVGAGVIAKQADKFPIIKTYLDYKEWEKAVSTYGRNWFEYIQADGRIHTKYKSMVDTARTSSGDVKKGPFPNMQNLSRDSDTRSCFEGQGGNNTLIIGDYSSQESVLMAEASREPALLEFFKSGGGDMHAYIAREIYPELKNLTLAEIKDKHPDKRTAAKSAGFAIQYGGTGYTIADNMNISVEDGQKIYEAYFKSFPKMKEYFDAVFKASLNSGYITTNLKTKRKRFIEGFEYLKEKLRDSSFWEAYWESKKTNGVFYKTHLDDVKKYNKLKSAIYKLCLNTPIQSTAADMSKTAGIFLLDWILETNNFGKIKIVNFVHDEYVLECHVAKAQAVADKLKELMEKAADLYTNELHIKVEPIISKCWKK